MVKETITLHDWFFSWFCAVKETLLLILDVYFAQAYITIHCIRVLSCTRQCQILCYGVVLVVRRHHCGHLIHRTVCAVCNEFNVQCSLFNVHWALCNEFNVHWVHLGTLLWSFNPPQCLHASPLAQQTLEDNKLWIFRFFEEYFSFDWMILNFQFVYYFIGWIILRYSRSCGHCSIGQMFTSSKHQRKAAALPISMKKQKRVKNIQQYTYNI